MEDRRSCKIQRNISEFWSILIIRKILNLISLACKLCIELTKMVLNKSAQFLSIDVDFLSEEDFLKRIACTETIRHRNNPKFQLFLRNIFF